MKKLGKLAVRCLPLSVVFYMSPVLADVYKCTDSSGRVTYTNVKGGPDRKCKILSKDQPVSTVSGSKPRAGSASSGSSSGGFPRVDSETQRSRDSERRRILQEELATEQSNLDKAKKELAEQETIRTGDERNYQKVLDRLQPFKDRVVLHERNIEALKKELSNVR